MSTEISLFQKFGLSTTNNFKYSCEVNAFLGNGYTSLAGNTYFNEIRILDGLLVKEDVGHGHIHTFLNGIRIYDLKSKVLLCDKRFNTTTYYSETTLKREIKELLSKLLFESSRKEGIYLNTNDVNAHLDKIIVNGFSTDQREMLANQAKLYLNK